MATQLLHKRSGLITDCMNRAALNHFDGMERKMRKLMITTVILVLAGGSANYARGGMHGLGEQRLMVPANPTVLPSLTPDTRLTGSAPLPPHHQPTAADVSLLPDTMLKPNLEDAAVDRMI